MQKLRLRFNEWSQYLKIDIWLLEKKGKTKPFFERALKILLITIKEFNKDQIALRASAMTYFSILSIVPLVAMLFGISKGFGIESLIQEELDKIFIGQEVVKESIFEFAQNVLNNTKGGVIVGVSIVALFFTVMKLLNNIENVFNSIWGKKTARNIIRKFTDYLALLLIAPILIILSSGVTIYVQQQLRLIGEQVPFGDYVTPFVAFSAQLSPFILIWLLFTLIYVIMPNVKVNLKSGLLAGVIAGTIFQFVQKAFISFSFLMGDYGAVYGSLAVLPLFFIFNQLSWTIVFIGGELSFAHQTVDSYIPDGDDVNLSRAEKTKMALLVATTIVKAFKEGDPALTKQMLADQLNVPHRFISDLVNRLVIAGVLTKSLSEQQEQHVYLPSLDIEKIDLQFVIKKLENIGASELYLTTDATLKSLEKAIDGLETDFTNSNNNILLKNI